MKLLVACLFIVLSVAIWPICPFYTSQVNVIVCSFNKGFFFGFFWKWHFPPFHGSGKLQWHLYYENILVLYPKNIILIPYQLLFSNFFAGTIFRLKGAILTMSFLDCNGVLIPSVHKPWKETEQKETPTKEPKTPSKTWS